MRDKFGDPPHPPLGAAIVASHWRKSGNVTIIDANAENLSIAETAKRIKEIKPERIGISCNYAPTYTWTKKLISQCDGFIEVGGNHATAMHRYLGNDAFPGAFVFEGAYSYYEMPAYDLLPMHLYPQHGIWAVMGCPFRCGFCASKVIFPKATKRPVEQVVDEIEYLKTHYGNKEFWSHDDTFFAWPQYTMDLLEEMQRRNLDIKFSCRTRIDRISGELLHEAIQAGCQYISYGIESGNQEMLDRMNKGITVDEIKKTLEITNWIASCNGNPFRHYAFFMVGLPGETHKTIADSYNLIAQSNLTATAWNIFIPLPGTTLMDDLLSAKTITLDELEWDMMFARIPDESVVPYSARLAERWCGLKAEELMGACKIGRHLK